MGILDSKLVYSDGQDLTATASSTNYVDHGVARDLGAGQELYLLLQFGTVVSNATLSAILKGDDDAGGTNNVDITTTPTITPVTGSFLAVPIRSHKPKRYTKVAFTITGGTSPHVPVTATLVDGPQVRAFSRIY